MKYTHSLFLLSMALNLSSSIHTSELSAMPRNEALKKILADCFPDGFKQRIHFYAAMSEDEMMAFVQQEKTRLTLNLSPADMFDDIEDLVELAERQTVNSIAFSLDGKLIASGFEDNIIRIWNRRCTDNRFQLSQTLYGRQNDGNISRSLAFSPDSNHLASISDSDIRIWERQTDDTFRIIQIIDAEKTEHYSAAYGNKIAFSSDGTLIAAPCDIFPVNSEESPSNTIRIFTRKGDHGFELSQIIPIDPPWWQNCVQSLIFSPDSELLAYHEHWSSDVKIWSRNNDNSFSEYQSLLFGPEKPWQPSCISTLAFSHNGALIAVGILNSEIDKDANILLWSREKNTTFQMIPYFETDNESPLRVLPSAITFSVDDKLLAAAVEGTVKIWSQRKDETFEFLQELDDDEDVWINDVALSHDGKFFACGSNDGTIKVWSRRKAKKFKLSQVLNKANDENTLSIMLNGMNGGNIFAISIKNVIKIWSNEDGCILHPLQVLHADSRSKNNNIHAMALTADNRFIAAGSENGTIRIWAKQEDGSFDSLQILDSKVGGHSNRINTMTFSLDGKFLASCSIDGIITMWSRQENNTFAYFSRITEHRKAVKLILLSPDANAMATLSNGTVTFWNRQENAFTFAQTLEYTAYIPKSMDHMEWISRAAFSPDNRSFAILSGDGAIKVFARNTDNAFQLSETLNDDITVKREFMGLCFSSDSKYIILYTGQEDTNIWPLKL